MRSSFSLLYSFALLLTLVTGASIPRNFEKLPLTRRQLSPTQVQREIGGRVSKTTWIFGPNDGRFANATSRWSLYERPRIQVVIEPALASDVSIIVKYCNENSIEFLAINRGHGSTATLGSFNGIEIDMTRFDTITIQPSGQSAWFGGGVYDGQATRYLWDKGYATATGACNCVGMLGPGLGGGHGPLEGVYGLISDNFRQLNVVLADGTAITVNETSHADLLWGMKGAGHNFGIVTSFEANIYPRGPDLWHYHNYWWSGDKLDAVFTALNNLNGNGTTPVNMTVNFGSFFWNTTISATEPSITWVFAYRGTAEVAERYLAPFNAIGAFYEESGDIPYPAVSTAQGNAENQYICQHGNTRITATAGLQVYNLTAEHKIYDGFKRRIASNPVLAAGGDILHEGYSTEAVDSKNPDDSAYPFRADHHLMLADIAIPPNNPEIERAAWEWVTEVRDQWNEGQPGRPVNAYVNYANGYEPVEQWYGHEAWRLERLRGLKAKYDPHNRFRYYNPIVGGHATSPYHR
ncbi:MAG: hypothetical protein Q9168_002732 [Polycauliona sp. 1 TL-2023]